MGFCLHQVHLPHTDTHLCGTGEPSYRLFPCDLDDNVTAPLTWLWILLTASFGHAEGSRSQPGVVWADRWPTGTVWVPSQSTEPISTDLTGRCHRGYHCQRFATLYPSGLKKGITLITGGVRLERGDLYWQKAAWLHCTSCITHCLLMILNDVCCLADVMTISEY